jgi:hypothetical protein
VPQFLRQTWGAGVAHREATPTLMVRKVQAQSEAVQSIISMAPILFRGAQKLFKHMRPPSGFAN